jgi:hypothetical protein
MTWTASMHCISDDQIWRYGKKRALYTYYMAVALNGIFCNINRYDIPEGVLILTGKDHKMMVIKKIINFIKNFNCELGVKCYISGKF